MIQCFQVISHYGMCRNSIIKYCSVIDISFSRTSQYHPIGAFAVNEVIDGNIDGVDLLLQ